MIKPLAVQLCIGAVIAVWIVSDDLRSWTDPVMARAQSTLDALTGGSGEDEAEPAYKPDLLVVGHDVIDPHSIEVKIGDWYFSVPVNRADTIFEENEYQLGEIDGFRIVGAWPGFHARSDNNVGFFRGVVNRVIYASVETVCPTRSSKPRSIPCTPERSMEITYGTATRQSGPGLGGQDFYERADLPHLSAPAMSGYELVGFIDRRRGDEQIMASEHDLNIYRRTDPQGRIDFASCIRRTSGYGCKHRFIWRDVFKITLRYAVQYQSQWPAIKEAVLATLDEMIIPAAEYLPPTPPWCDRIPFPRPPELRVPRSVQPRCPDRIVL